MKMRLKMKKTALIVMGLLIFSSLLLGACAGAEEVADGLAPQSPSEEKDGFYGDESAESESENTSDQGGITSAIDRMMIYDANLEIAVVEPDAEMQSIIKMAEEAGGFVVSSNSYKTFNNGRSLPRASVTVRVPAEKLESIMAAIKDLAPNPGEDVISENVSGQDVTSEYTDLSSRLRNLESAEEALVALMEDARDPEDVLAIFDELTYYRGEIEVVKGRMKYLEESAALSALTVNLVAKESLQPIEIGGWQPKGTAKRAVEALIEAVQFVGNAAIWFGIYCLPFLIPLGIGAYFLIRLIRKRRAAKKADKVEVIESSETES
jgi:hypothetical protein